MITWNTAPWRDNFNRANAPHLGVNWALGTAGSFGISGNKAVSLRPDSDLFAMWNKADDRVAYSPDYYVEAKISRHTSGSGAMGITGKAYFEGSGDSSNTTSTGQQSYTAQVFWSGSAAKLYLRQHKNNVSSFVKSDIPVTWANGNTLRMEFRGNVIYTYRNGVEVTGMRYTIPALENDRFPDVCGSFGLFSSGGTGGTWDDFSWLSDDDRSATRARL